MSAVAISPKVMAASVAGVAVSARKSINVVLAMARNSVPYTGALEDPGLKVFCSNERVLSMVLFPPGKGLHHGATLKGCLESAYPHSAELYPHSEMQA